MGSSKTTVLYWPLSPATVRRFKTQKVVDYRGKALTRFISFPGNHNIGFLMFWVAGLLLCISGIFFRTTPTCLTATPHPQPSQRETARRIFHPNISAQGDVCVNTLKRLAPSTGHIREYGHFQCTYTNVLMY